MRTRNASTIFHRVGKLANSVFQKTDSKKQPLRFSATFWRVDPLRVLAALLGVFFIISSNYMISRSSAVTASTENISTYAASDCATPKSEWNLGQTVCAVVTGVPNQQRIVWIAPDGGVAQVSASFTGTGTDNYTLPTGSDPLAQYGTWKVESMDNAGVGFVITTFLVRPENIASTDLSVLNFGPLQAVAGNTITYTVQLTNRGPDTAQNVALSASVPNDSTFAAEAQNSGPTANCTNPSGGSGGTSTCTIPTLAANETATFTFIYNVNSGTPVDTTIANTVSVSSSTQELFQIDNTASSITVVVSTPPTPPCSISCPTSITTPLTDPTQCSVVVTYTTPGLSGSCTDPDTGRTPTVVCSPPSGATFPTGTTTVVCAAGGTTCSFTVTVQDTRPPVALTMTCPGNVTATESADGSGSTTVNYPAPTTTGNCVTVSCDPASGTVFFVGTTPVTCTAQDSANNTTSCSFTVTVTANGGGGCTITCPGDITRTASAGQCSAAVTFADPTTSGSCSAATCKDQNNTVRHSGDSFPVGVTLITCTTSEGASCDFAITVNPASPPTITTCASNKTVSANANCEAAIPNLISEVVATGCSVSLSQSPTAGTIVGIGPITVTITAENLAGETTCTATVTVVENTPPVITTCPAASSASANSSCQAAVPNVLGGVTATDNCTPSGALVISQSPAAGTLVGVGITTITITVRDQSGNASTCTTTFTVNDVTPPVITGASANPSTLWPPNHKMKDVTINYTATDNCSGTINSSLSVTSNEGTPDDWVIVDAHHVQLRAERDGNGNGRIYTIRITSTDSHGNSTSTTVTVTVPHNQ